MVSQELADISDADFQVCTPELSPPIIAGFTLTQNQQLPKLLYVAILSQATPIPYSLLSEPLSNSAFSGIRTYLLNSINSKFSLSLTSLPTTITDLTPNEIAALDSRCFVSGVLQDIGRNDPSHKSLHRFHNDRENRDMRLLQINFKSLAIWNKVGRYVQFNSGIVTNNNSNEGFSAEHRLFSTASSDSDAPEGSFQNLGLAASDSSDGGLVIYGTIDSSDYPDAAGNTSPYGFALTQGQQLISLARNLSINNPLGVTFASDQAIYVQGNYNSVNKQPTAILGDSINILSNACLNANKAINKNSDRNCDIDGSKQNGAETIINTAFLGGTDITNSSSTSGYNGGLENYPRFSENWAGQTLTYRGSFVSLGTPIHVRGRWLDQEYDAPNRNWDYDLDFNDADNLPPLTPRFVYLRQESFIRNFQ
ncbi:MAG: hypothetical protein AB4060_18215 [Crocosphaera sp.]